MRTRIVCVAGIVLIWVAAFGLSARSDESTVHFPTSPVAKEPETPNDPTVIHDVRVGELYVIESTEKPLLVADSREGFVGIRTLKGPLEFFAKFSDSIDRDQYESRTYSSQFIYVVQAQKSGEIELITSSDNVILKRILLTVTVGPRPPPGPGPGPEPKPEPTPQAENVSLAIVEDTMNRTPEMAITMNGLVGWTEFVDSGNDWRAYDLTTGEARGKKAITDLNGPSPGIVIYDKATGKMIHRGDMPATIDDLKTLIGGLTGG